MYTIRSQSYRGRFTAQSTLTKTLLPPDQHLATGAVDFKLKKTPRHTQVNRLALKSLKVVEVGSSSARIRRYSSKAPEKYS
jgi:hypothetical protein